ncbi:MAG TPA: hypothetical protein VF610_03010 [Segetibacter sp.]|jgi:hypothetical protein
MRKYIIGFTYREVEFTAKVLVKVVNGKAIVSTTLLHSELDFVLGKATLVLLKKNKQFILVLLQKDNSWELLPWQMNAEFKEKCPVLPSSGFSLS